VDFEFPLIFHHNEVKPGRLRQSPIGAIFQLLMPAQPWVRWRRLLLRLCASTFLQAWQVMMSVARQPQLRSARRLQHRREQLEKEALNLAQQEQRMIAEAASSSSMATPGDLNVSRDEDRKRPMAMIQGRGKYLVPQLEKSPQCPHKSTKHGANRLASYNKCTDCGQEQSMPLTPVSDLNHWNHTLVYLKQDFIKRQINKEIQRKNENLGATAKASSMPRPTAAKSRPKAEVKVEIEEDWHRPVWEEDVAMEMSYQAHTQSCDFCQVGEVTLHRHVDDNKLLWKCNNPQCRLHLMQMAGQLVEAQGVMLCPQCQSNELMPVTVGEKPDETEVQCMNQDCGISILLFELPLLYSRMNRFNVRYL
jgi:hypothetical protein